MRWQVEPKPDRDLHRATRSGKCSYDSLTKFLIRSLHIFLLKTFIPLHACAQLFGSPLNSISSGPFGFKPKRIVLALTIILWSYFTRTCYNMSPASSSGMVFLSISYAEIRKRPFLPILYGPISPLCITSHILKDVGPSNLATLLSILEGLDLAREMSLALKRPLHPDIPLSDNPLPIRSLSIRVDTKSSQLTKQLLHKCSQSLRELHLYPQDTADPPMPFLPHLCRFSLYSGNEFKGEDLTPWLPFLDQHPTITHVLLDPSYSIVVAPIPPNLLPHLRSLGAHTAIIPWLIPGRPVHNVSARNLLSNLDSSHLGLMFQSLQLSRIPLASAHLRSWRYSCQYDPKSSKTSQIYVENHFQSVSVVQKWKYS
jgi:hypothetical protein